LICRIILAEGGLRQMTKLISVDSEEHGIAGDPQEVLCTQRG
jgi:hypothetical protein